MHEQLNTYTAVLGQPQVAASGAVAWLEHPGVPRRLPVPNLIGAAPLETGLPAAIAPGLGEHTEAILREHGFAASEIARLRDAGVVQM